MSVRALSGSRDWTFGSGTSNYLSGISEVAQNIQTRVLMFLGDCFFAKSSGIDWYNLLGSKNTLALNLAVSATILNTPNVTGIRQLSLTLDNVTRKIRVTYEVQTTFGNTSNQFQYDIAA